MSKEELRLSNQAKKLLNEMDPKSGSSPNGTQRVEKPNKRRSHAPIKRSVDEVHQVPSSECSTNYSLKVLPMEQHVDDEKLIKICVNLHKSTFNCKQTQDIDVRLSQIETTTTK